MRRAWQYVRKLGERGATAVEFAIVGSLFLMLLLAIFELGYMVFVQSVLDSSARTAAKNSRGNPQKSRRAGRVAALISSIFKTLVFAAGMRAKRSAMFALTVFQNQLIRCTRS